MTAYQPMSDAELAAYLGPAADTITDEQRDLLLDVDRHIAGRFPVPADADIEARAEHDDAFAGAVMYVLGDENLGSLAMEYRRAKSALDEALAQWRGAAIAASRSGASISEIASLSMVSRPMVYKALGERD